MQPHTASKKCPICEGHRDLPQGRGTRCWGFTDDDGEYAHCTREDLAGGIPEHRGTQAYPHILHGECRCGHTHGEARLRVDSKSRSIGSARSARVVAEYDYRSSDGKIIYQVQRTEPKSFRVRHPDGSGGWAWGRGGIDTVPYRLPEILDGTGKIFVVEGEKDVESLRARGVLATCNAGGAGKWLETWAGHFEGRDVVVIGDDDEPGIAHARDVISKISGVARSVRGALPARGYKDISEHLEAGLGETQLRELSDPIPQSVSPGDLIRRSLTVPEVSIRLVDQERASQVDPTPSWPTALDGGELTEFRGVTFLTGGPSAGKSWLAIASSLAAAESGWRVLYLASEMSDHAVMGRALSYLEGRPVPKNWEVYEVTFGTSVDELVERVADRAGDGERTLVVLDSVNSFVDQALIQSDEGDVHGIGPLKRLVMWAMNVRRSVPSVGFLVLSEKNAAGETKGRFGDHKADMVLSVTINEDSELVRRLVVTKSWHSQTGEVGLFGLDPRRCRLTRLSVE